MIRFAESQCQLFLLPLYWLFIVSLVLLVVIAHSVQCGPLAKRARIDKRADLNDVDWGVGNERWFDNHLLVYDQNRNPDSDHADRKTAESDTNSNEIFLPIDSDLLVPKQSRQQHSVGNHFSTTEQPTNEKEKRQHDSKLLHLEQVSNRLLVNQHADRRFLMMFPPFKRLLMAYFAPRILKFQFVMLLNSLIGELSRKFLDPLIGLGRSQTSVDRTPTPKSASTSASSQSLTMSDLQQLSSLLALTSGTGTGANSAPSQPSAVSTSTASLPIQSSPPQPAVMITTESPPLPVPTMATSPQSIGTGSLLPSSMDLMMKLLQPGSSDMDSLLSMIQNKNGSLRQLISAVTHTSSPLMSSSMEALTGTDINANQGASYQTMERRKS